MANMTELKGLIDNWTPNYVYFIILFLWNVAGNVTVGSNKTFHFQLHTNMANDVDCLEKG